MKKDMEIRTLDKQIQDFQLRKIIVGGNPVETQAEVKAYREGFTECAKIAAELLRRVESPSPIGQRSTAEKIIGILGVLIHGEVKDND